MADLLKHISFGPKNGYNNLVGITPYVYRNTHSPALAVVKIYPVDAALTTIKMVSTEDWNFTARLKLGDDVRYVLRMEILLQVSFHLGARFEQATAACGWNMREKKWSKT